MKAVYRYLVDHLTKGLGGLGVALMSLFALDPQVVHDAALLYLGDHAAAKLGGILFGLVILRGWYTGIKAKETAVALATAQAALPPPDPADPAVQAPPPSRPQG